MPNEEALKRIEQRLAAMTIEQKLGHLIIWRVYTRSLQTEKDYICDMLRRGVIGALQAPTGQFATPLGEAERRFPFEARELSPEPLLICADMESGFPAAERKLPCQLALSSAAANDESLAYEFGRITAIEAKKAGFNLVWGPNVDLIGPEQRMTVQRRLSADPYRVAHLAELIVRGYTDEGMIYTAKHAPGGCDAVLDTHLYAGNPSMKTERELMEWDFIPYLELMKNVGLPGMMSNHRFYPNIDPDFPPTLSKKIVSMIRNTGFDGLLITDSLGMVGIIDKYGEDACIGQSIAAGHDMIIPNYRISCRETMERMTKAYENGVFTEERVNEAVRRVLIAQESATKPAAQDRITEKEIICIDRMNSEAVFAVTDEGVSPAIDKDKSHLFVVLVENLYKNADGDITEVNPVESWKPEELEAQLKADFPNCHIEEICEYPSRMQMHDVSYCATHYDDVVFLTYCKGMPYGVHDHLTRRVTRLMDALQSRIAAIVHVGNPYALDEVPHVPRLIGGFSGGECEKYVLEVLAGKRVPVGKSPVKLNLK